MTTRKQIIGLTLSTALLVTACTGSQDTQPETSDTSGTTETNKTEPTSSTNPDILPEFAEATRPSLEIPDSDTYTDVLEEIKERYLLYQEAFIYAGSAPEANPNDPTLANLMTGRKTENVKRQLGALRDDGWIYVLPDPTISASQIKFVGTVGPKEVEGNTIYMKDCLIDDSKIVRLSDGHIGEEETITVLLTVEMRFTDGEWRVAATSEDKRYEGESECAGDF